MIRTTFCFVYVFIFRFLDFCLKIAAYDIPDTGFYFNKRRVDVLGRNGNVLKFYDSAGTQNRVATYYGKCASVIDIEGCRRLDHEFEIMKHIYENGGEKLIASKFAMKTLVEALAVTEEDITQVLMTSNEGIPLELIDESDLNESKEKIISKLDNQLKKLGVTHNDLEERNVIVNTNDCNIYKVIDFEDSQLNV